MKTIKIYLSTLCLLVLAGVMTSCEDFLEEKPLDAKSSNQFWESEADASSAVNALYYGGVPYLNNNDFGTAWAIKATMCNGVFSGLFVDKEKHSNSIANASEALNLNVASFDNLAMAYWHEFYKGISRANFVIANIPTMAGVLDEPTIKNYVAQAKFFRAYGYFYLVKEFGDVPYVDEPYTSTDGMFKERVPAAQVYQYIETDLLDAINSGALPDRAFYDNGCYVTKSTAQTLLAIVYLQWAGQPINGGNTYYDKAAQMAKNVITGGKHELIQATGSSDDLNSAFNVIKTTKSSNEIIYAKEYNYSSFNVGNSYALHGIEREAMSWGVFRNNLLHNSYLPCPMILNSYEPGDIRSHEKQFFFKNYTSAGGTVFTLNNVGNWAWFDEEALVEGHDGDNNVPTFRYAEVLLIAAEGLARVGGSDGEARGYLNQVRTRAGLAGETVATGDALVKIILTERLHEFPLEFKVWDDIRRTRWYPEADGMNTGTLKWTPLASATIQNKPEGITKVGAIPEWALLWPLPLTEMQSNPSLTPQNPNWN
jgi:hypothetical protein